MEAILKSKDEVLQIKDEQLRLAQAREVFYQEELRSVRLLMAPPSREQEKKWFWLF